MTIYCDCGKYDGTLNYPNECRDGCYEGTGMSDQEGTITALVARLRGYNGMSQRGEDLCYEAADALAAAQARIAKLEEQEFEWRMGLDGIEDGRQDALEDLRTAQARIEQAEELCRSYRHEAEKAGDALAAVESERDWSRGWANDMRSRLAEVEKERDHFIEVSKNVGAMMQKEIERCVAAETERDAAREALRAIRRHNDSPARFDLTVETICADVLSDHQTGGDHE